MFTSSRYGQKRVTEMFMFYPGLFRQCLDVPTGWSAQIMMYQVTRPFKGLLGKVMISPFGLSIGFQLSQ